MTKDNQESLQEMLEIHTKRVVNLVDKFTRYLGIEDGDRTKILMAAELHDIGKLELGENVFKKKNVLNKKDLKLLEEHPYKSYLLAKKYTADNEILGMILLHHERVDGQGYPYRLSGPDLLLGTKIITICNFFDEAITNKGYKNINTKQDAIQVIQENLNKKFDEKIGRKFISFLEIQLQDNLELIL